MDADERAHKVALARHLFDLHRCPTTGRIIESDKSDDKALCHCGQTNPKVAATGCTESPNTHIKRFLTVATAEEYVAERYDNGKAD
jgi:hypothetical protein